MVLFTIFGMAIAQDLKFHELHSFYIDHLQWLNGRLHKKWLVAIRRMT